MQARLPIILDTDPGIDDAMAMAYLAADPRVELMAITTVFGNAGVTTTTRNALYLRNRLGLAAPVHRGADQPLDGPRGAGAAHVHGHDGLGGLGLSTGVEDGPAMMPAHEAMVEAINRRPGDVRLLAIGPLTNLALALRLDSSIAAKVREVVVMGGAFGGSGRGGNVTPFAEANIHNDPRAAAEVFAAQWPVRIVGLDVTLDCVLTSDQARQLAGAAGPVGQLLWDISRDYEAMYREADGLAGCALHDVAAAVCLLEPQLFTCDRTGVEVSLEGSMRGQTRAVAVGPVHGICRAVRSAAVVDTYLETLIRAAAVVAGS